MNAWCEDMSSFARAIHGEIILPNELAVCPHYPVTTALDIYRNNYRGNLHDTLAGAYPVIAQLVGKDFFRQLTQRFIALHPSRSGNLHLYGAEFAVFIASFAPAQGLPYLSDVARLEWACHCAYFAADAATLDINKLSQIAPERYSDLILFAHTACHVVRSAYPVAAIWHAHQPGAPDDFHIDLDSGACCALVTRHDDVVQVSELTEAEADWLLSIQAGNSLGAATAATLNVHADFDLRATLLNLVAHRVFTDFKLEAMP